MKKPKHGGKLSHLLTRVQFKSDDNIMYSVNFYGQHKDLKAEVFVENKCIAEYCGIQFGHANKTNALFFIKDCIEKKLI